MKNAVVKTKSKGFLTTLDSVRKELDELVKNEENKAKQTSGNKQKAKRFVYTDQNGIEHTYSVYSLKSLFGIDVDISNKFIEISDSENLELSKLVGYYNQTHPKTQIDIEEKLKIFREIRSTTYTTIDEEGRPIGVNFDQLYDIIKKRYPKIKPESVYIYLRKMHEAGDLKYDDIVDEIGRRYGSTKSKSYMYLYPDENGSLVERSLNAIVTDYNNKNPESKLNFDSIKKYIEQAIEEGAAPEDAVCKGIELYNENVRSVSKFLLKNVTTGEYENVTASQVKSYWNSSGLKISKSETVLKFLRLAAQIPDIKPEEIVDKAMELALEKIKKYDVIVDDKGTIEKLTMGGIAKRFSTADHKFSGQTLSQKFMRLKEEKAGSNLNETELMMLAISECNNSARHKYPVVPESGETDERDDK